MRTGSPFTSITPSGQFDLVQTLTFGFGQREAVRPPPQGQRTTAATSGAGVVASPGQATTGDAADQVPTAIGDVVASMRLAFVLDGYQQSAGALVQQLSTGELRVQPVGSADPDAVVRQVARVLSVDVDATGWDALGECDPLVGRVQRARPGLRPPLFYSAYEALVWAVLSARRPAPQMARVRDAVSAEHGTAFDVGGRRMHALPTPAQLLTVDSVAGVSEVKMRRLHAVARAALDGGLDTAALRALPPAEAAAAVRTLDGIGPFYAELVVIRALGHTDVLPLTEPRLLALLGQLTGAGRPLTADELVALAARWVGWRTWAAVAIRAAGLS